MFFRILFVILALSTQVFAAEKQIHMKGFLTFAFEATNSQVEYVDDLTKSGNFIKGTKAGLQFFSIINSKLEAHLQFLVDGEEGSDFDANLDIAHLNLSLDEKNKFVFGKIRIPVWLLSDYIQVGSLYPWIRPPDEVYEVAPLDTLGAHHTFMGIAYERVLWQNDTSKLVSNIYTGGSEKTSPPSGRGGNTEVEAKLSGVTLDYQIGNFQTKLSYLNVLSNGEKYDLLTNTNLNEAKFRTQFSSLGIRYDNNKYVSMTELSLIDGETNDINHIKSYYTMLGRYFKDSEYLTHITAGHIDESSNSNINVSQTSVSLGFNYFYDISTVFKLEWQNVFIKTNTPGSPSGLFREYPGSEVQVFSASINTMF